MALQSRKLTVKVAGAAVLASLSVIMQALPPLFVTPWFMRIDFVAVPWVLCWLLFGFDSALLSLIVSAPLVGYLGFFPGGWVGAVMKSVASVWMFAVPALFSLRIKEKKLVLNKKMYGIASVAALLVRAVVAVIFNFYFALPFFFGMTPDGIVQFFNISRTFIGLSLGLAGLGAFVAEVAFWNILQGVIDIYAAYVIGFIVQRRVFGTTRQ